MRLRSVRGGRPEVPGMQKAAAGTATPGASATNQIEVTTEGRGKGERERIYDQQDLLARTQKYTSTNEEC